MQSRIGLLLLSATLAGCLGDLPDTPDDDDLGLDLPAQLPPSPAAPLEWNVGAPLAPAVVSGRIYGDLAANAPGRMRDLAALGVRLIRIEIERDTPWPTYKTIVDAARSHGIETLAVVSLNSVPGRPDPLAGTRSYFDTTYVPAYIAALDETVAQTGVRFVEVWNEPDNYGFQPMFLWSPTSCTRLEGATRYALLAVRVFETLDQRRRKGIATPTIAAFGVSRHDDGCLRQALADSEPVRNHRFGYRNPYGMSDGLPTDIVAMHGYGNAGKLPSEIGYTYSNRTFADGVDELLAARFADGARIVGSMPVWYTEVGYSRGALGGADPARRQADALATVFAALRARPQITAAFWYDYRDDEPTPDSEGNTAGLRGNSVAGYAPHPSYVAFQAAAAVDDRGAPTGALTTPTPSTQVQRGARLAVRGWAIDADGAAPSIEVAIDGKVVATGVDGNAPIVGACAIAWSARCPNNVGFSVEVTLPAAPGTHELAVRARDARGNARVIGRVPLAIP